MKRVELNRIAYIRGPPRESTKTNFQRFRKTEGERKNMKMPNNGELLVEQAKEAAYRMIIELTYQSNQTQEILELREKIHKLLEK